MEEKIELLQLLEKQETEMLRDTAQPFLELMMQYRCAMMEIETKLNVLNEEFTMQHQRNPFESIRTRLKAPASILEKLRRKGLPVTIESLEKKIFDIAGIRVICSFPDDIYAIARLLLKQDDVRLLECRDYIKNPKENGYRSLHLILEVPVFLSTQKKWMKVEVQFRTIAMDFWASLEHKLKYKKDIDNAENISADLKECAQAIGMLDFKMQEIRDRIADD